MNFFIGIAAVVVFTAAGIIVSGKYSSRFKFFSCLGEFNSAVFRDVNFRRDGVLEVLKRQFSFGDFNAYCKEVSLSLANDLEIPSPPDYLEKEDREYVVKYFETAGYCSGSTASDFLTEQRTRIGERTEELKSESRKFSSLGLKLGFSVGLIFFVIVI